jgi:D-alanyl-D-alanine carboxypeptidase/D-alanyl-D-alanine-endopeptidase (penicillin-binding protein 4)
MATAVLLLSLGVVPGSATSGLAQGLPARLGAIVDAAGTKVGLVVLDDRGRTVYSRNGDQRFVPASVMKIVTSAASLTYLGLDFRFTTRLVGEGISGDRIETLYVVGGGDPGLTIESAVVMARRLRSVGVRRIDRLVLDTTLFDEERPRSGSRAYEAGASALSFNFNATSVLVCPRKAGADAVLSIEPWETGGAIKGRVQTVRGTRDEVQADLEHPGGFSVQVGGVLGEDAGCVAKYRSVADPAEYFGRTFLGLLAGAGIVSPKKFERGRVTSSATVIYTHESKPLSHVLQDLNWYSNNFIAGQLVYALGGGAGRWSRAKGLARMAEYLRASGFSPEGFTILDGAGLDHGNRLTPANIAAVLAKVSTDPRINVEFLHGLSMAGVGGTLKRRDFDEAARYLRAKTGTLDGVSSLAGFVTGRGGTRYTFALVQNGVSSPGGAHETERRLVTTLFSSDG